ncbi:hypothetical protein DER45DRAFT_403046 [Fusarium avenaceum]|nr:hypothetical protein DER45DRAFT_403046 [Fusarium avenaceum]
MRIWTYLAELGSVTLFLIHTSDAAFTRGGVSSCLVGASRGIASWLLRNGTQRHGLEHLSSLCWFDSAQGHGLKNFRNILCLSSVRRHRCEHVSNICSVNVTQGHRLEHLSNIFWPSDAQGQSLEHFSKTCCLGGRGAFLLSGSHRDVGVCLRFGFWEIGVG